MRVWGHWGYVYVIAHNENGCLCGPVKVGISSNPDGRLRKIRSDCVGKIELFFMYLCHTREVARGIELLAHETLKERKMNGEWFNVNPRDGASGS